MPPKYCAADMRLAVVAAVLLAVAGTAAVGSEPLSLNSSDYLAAVQRSARALAEEFRAAATSELGAALFDTAPPPPPPRVSAATSDVEDLLNSIAEKLKSKLTSAITILYEMKKMVLNRTDTPSFTHPCPLNSIRKAAYVRQEDDIPRVDSKVHFDERLAPPKWWGRFRDLKVKRQYFLSDIDHATDEDCAVATQATDDLRALYHRIVDPNSKLIIFLVNKLLNPRALRIAVSIVKETLNVMQPTDKLMFRTTSGTGFFMFEDICTNVAAPIANATDDNKALLHEHLTHLNSATTQVNYESLHRHIRLQLLKLDLPKDILLIFLTDRKTPEAVNSITTHPLVEGDHVFYSAVGFIDETIHFSTNDSLKIHREMLDSRSVKLNIFSDLNGGQVASALLSVVPRRQEEAVGVGAPYWEPTQRDFMIPVVLRLQRGVLGLDLYWSDLAEDITYLRRSVTRQRAFVMDMSATVLMHSFFPRPELSIEKIKFTRLELVENHNHIFDVKHQILGKSIGHLTVPLNNATNLIYSWRRVRELFIVCIVTEQGEAPMTYNLSDNFYAPRNPRDILYHRLDLFPPKSGNICRHFKQIATIDQGTVYLSPSSFHSPFTYLHDMSDGPDTALTYMQNYLAYLKGVAFRFLSNPGLKNDIRNDVSLLNSIITYFKRQHMQGLYSKYIVRRYAVAESGVLVMFPGSVLEYDYEPVRRPWYMSAVENMGKIILSPPNLDVGGAGYVVSISYALQSKNYPFMVASMDVTLGFLYKMLIDSFPHCKLVYVKCFIMNDRGYLISHPGLMDPNGSGPVEQQHITHMESLIAIDMLNHKGFVTKRLCNNFSDRTIQRFYEFNTSLPDVLSKVVSGDHCVHYYIAAIKGTNAFVGVVNATCNLGAFCPCSMVDRLCLNCNRMEQNECECPCECSSNVDFCPVNNVPTNDLTDIPLCGGVPENNHHKSHYFHNFAENLKPCFDFQCENYMSYSSCLGVMGCEWCQLDTDAETPLAAPFCTSQSTCFNGVLGAVTPYGEGTVGHVVCEDVFRSYSAIGPIAGCLVTVCLIVAIAIYCYKQNVTSASCRELYVDGPAEPWPDQDMQLSHLPSEDMHDHSGQDKLLPAAEAEPPISPYKILTGYKRPNTTGDSDHGYSTMTPHEDSEAMAFSMTEPIVMLDDTNLSDISCSVSTKHMSKARQKPFDMSATVLPCGKNSIIAPVTVHRHMEAS